MPRYEIQQTSRHHTHHTHESYLVGCVMQANCEGDCIRDASMYQSILGILVGLRKQKLTNLSTSQQQTQVLTVFAQQSTKVRKQQSESKVFL